MDIFPEDSYNPDTGEYTTPSNFNFDPIFTERVEVAPGIFLVFDVTDTRLGDLASNIFNRLEDLITKGWFDVEGNKNPKGYPPLPDEFDTSGKTTRGPFPDMVAVQNFLDESGLEGIAIFYYDEQTDLYWCDVNTE